MACIRFLEKTDMKNQYGQLNSIHIPFFSIKKIQFTGKLFEAVWGVLGQKNEKNQGFYGIHIPYIANFSLNRTLDVILYKSY